MSKETLSINIDTVMKKIDEYAGLWALVDTGFDGGWCRSKAEALKAEIKATLEEAHAVHVQQLTTELNQVRTQGINYAAAHVAGAFESGFIDKPEAEVMDVVNMILITSEFIESADPSDFTGEYPRDVLKSYRESLAEEVQS